MKHLKLYEMIEDEPQLGDYIIFKEASFSNYKHSKDAIKFMKNNLGKIVDIDIDNKKPYYLIQYEKILKPPIMDFYTQDGNRNSRWITKEEIEYFSKNKKDLKIYIDASKLQVNIISKKLKHLKLYELIKDKPKIGNYIVIEFPFRVKMWEKMWENYIESQIGEIIEIKKWHGNIEAEYRAIYYVDDYIYDKHFVDGVGDKSLIEYQKNGEKFIIMHINRENIIFFSSNKKDCETYLEAKKYNL